jgi:glycolate oxidase FAD binding subunit
VTRYVPTTAEQLAALLSQHAAAGHRIALSGNGSKAAMGGVVRDADVEISTSSLRGILQYDPRDLTVSVAAGTPWREFTAALAAQRQMVALDPPRAATSTVGGVVAANVSGPRRRLHGTARDVVIGMRFAMLDGQLAHAGAMVVKNVAGLDTQKVLIGSFGTLAALVSVNFKLAPAPPASRTFVYRTVTAAEAVAVRDRVLASVLQPAAIDVLNPSAARWCGLAGTGYAVAIEVGAGAAVLARYARELHDARVPEEAQSFWDAVQEFAPSWIEASPTHIILRVMHPIAELGAVLESHRGAAVARAGTGVAYLAFEHAAPLAEWRAATAGRGWAAIVEWSGPAVQAGLELWPEPGDDFALMQKVKLLFDPQHVLNPGRLHGRL